jgi:NhaA family Na+:H+ antiporter
MVIALFYTEQIRWIALLVAGVFMVLIVLLGRTKIRRPGFFIILAIGVWAGVFASGVHATVAGILVAMLIPVRSQIDPKTFLRVADEKLHQLRESELTDVSMISSTAQYDQLEELHHTVDDMGPPGLKLEHHLHPIQAFFILPLFAFFNAGVAITAEMLRMPPAPVTLGIIIGLFVGKQIGIFLFSWLAVKTGRAALPDGGVGSTMSLFISELAFLDADMISDAKLGILVGSLLSGVVGYLILSRTLPKNVES